MTKIDNPEVASTRTGDLTLNLIRLSAEDCEMNRAVIFAASALIARDAIARGETNAEPAIERLREALEFNIEMNQGMDSMFTAGRA